MLREQTAEAEHTLTFPSHLMYVLWGAVYAVGYLPLALSRGAWAVAAIPLGLAIGVFFACLAAGVAASAIVSARHGRGLRGAGSRQGALYGLTWALAFTGVFAISIRIGRLGLDGDAAGILINGVALLLVGVIFMGGGLAWQDDTQFRIGAVLCAVVTIALVTGLPAYYWILVTYGAALAVTGLVLTVRRRAALDEARR